MEWTTSSRDNDYSTPATPSSASALPAGVQAELGSGARQSRFREGGRAFPGGWQGLVPGAGRAFPGQPDWFRLARTFCKF
jgi:hypothetical protein